MITIPSLGLSLDSGSPLRCGRNDKINCWTNNFEMLERWSIGVIVQGLRSYSLQHSNTPSLHFSKAEHFKSFWQPENYLIYCLSYRYYVDTNTIASSAKTIPIHCLMVSVSCKNSTAQAILSMGYNADSEAMIETGPFETANRKHSAPKKPSTPAVAAKATPLGCVSNRKSIKNKTTTERKMPPITSYTMALLGSMYRVVILGTKLHSPQHINVPKVGKTHAFICITPRIFDPG